MAPGRTLPPAPPRLRRRSPWKLAQRQEGHARAAPDVPHVESALPTRHDARRAWPSLGVYCGWGRRASRLREESESSEFVDYCSAVGWGSVGGYGWGVDEEERRLVWDRVGEISDCWLGDRVLDEKTE